MPYQIDPKYISLLRIEFENAVGLPPALGDWDINEVVNETLENGRIPKDASKVIMAMQDKESQIRQARHR